MDTDGGEAKENVEAAANVGSDQQPLGQQSAAKRIKLEPKAGTPAAAKPPLSR